MAYRLILGAMSAAALVLLGTAAAAQGRQKAGDPAAEESMLFAISYRAGPKWQPGVPMEQQGLRDHFFYIKALDDGGRIVVAGPVGPDAGLFIVRATDQRAADAIVANDPAIRAGIFAGEARPFVPRFVGKVPPAPVRPR